MTPNADPLQHVQSTPGYQQYIRPPSIKDERPFSPVDCPLIDLDELRPPEHQTAGGPRFSLPTQSSRTSDVKDTLASYKHAQDCGLSSLDIHMPFSPLCSDKKSLLNAMSGGGRAGYDMPYMLVCATFQKV